MDKISIIIPVYNAEDKLHRCLDSVLKQSYKDIEVIIINDGSTDGSLSICESYKSKDNRVIIIDKKNAGVSAARNSGLRIATGKYIQFVDSDDFVNENMSERLVEKIKENDSDVVICGYHRIEKNRVTDKFSKETTISEICDFKDKFSEIFKGALFNVPWNKLYKREKIKEYFKENLCIGEDLLFNLSYFLYCDKIKIIEDCLYNYDVLNEDSLASKYNKELFEMELMLYKEVRKFFKKCFKSDDFRNINAVFAKEIYYFLKKLVVLSDENKESKLKKIKYCEENKYVKEAINNIAIDDKLIKIVCLLMKLKSERSIYLFFKVKEFINRNLKR